MMTTTMGSSVTRFDDDDNGKSVTRFSQTFAFSAAANRVLPGSGCGSVDSAVASNTRGPGFESSLRQLF